MYLLAVNSAIVFGKCTYEDTNSPSWSGIVSNTEIHVRNWYERQRIQNYEI